MTNHRHAAADQIETVKGAGHLDNFDRLQIAQVHATLALAEAADAQVAATLAQNTLLAHLVISQTVTMTARQGEMMAQSTARIQANADRVKS